MKFVLICCSLILQVAYSQNSFTTLSELRSIQYKRQTTCSLDEQRELIKNHIEIDSINEKLLQITNYYRNLANSNSLALSSEACVYAQTHAESMAKLNMIYHSDIENSPHLGENVLYLDYHVKTPRLQSLPMDIISVWLHSVKHNVHMNSNAPRAGFGVTYKIINDCYIRVYAVFITTNKL